MVIRAPKTSVTIPLAAYTSQPQVVAMMDNPVPWLIIASTVRAYLVTQYAHALLMQIVING